jgi:hypothetical protein
MNYSNLNVDEFDQLLNKKDYFSNKSRIIFLIIIVRIISLKGEERNIVMNQYQLLILSIFNYHPVDDSTHLNMVTSSL